jgi:hypothetical protein
MGRYLRQSREAHLNLSYAYNEKLPATKAGNSTRGVGPFWFVRDDSGRVLLMAHRCALAAAEEYGDFITCPHGHYEVWEGWRTMRAADLIVRDAEYEEWPRGRVVFNSIKGQFIVYADKQIRPGEFQRVPEYFGIPAGGVVFMTDDHYRSTRSLHTGRDRQ